MWLFMFCYRRCWQNHQKINLLQVYVCSTLNHEEISNDYKRAENRLNMNNTSKTVSKYF